MSEFTHFNEKGYARMVDVSDKSITRRTARAEGRVIVSAETFQMIRSGGISKGDVLTTAQIAGITKTKYGKIMCVNCAKKEANNG